MLRSSQLAFRAPRVQPVSLPSFRPFTQLAIQKFVLVLQNAYLVLKASNPFFEPDDLSLFGQVTLVSVG